MDLNQFWEISWNELVRAKVDPRHPFKSVVLATTDEYPSLRTVINRGMNEKGHFYIYSDQRAQKISQLQDNENCALLFYHPKKKLQIRIKGIARLHLEGKIYDEYHQRAAQNPKDYQSISAPGSKTTDPEKVAYTDKIHFALIEIIPREWDLLMLGKPFHRRAIFDAHQNGHWVIP